MLLLGVVIALELSDCQQNALTHRTYDSWIRSLGHEPAQLVADGDPMEGSEMVMNSGPLREGGRFPLFKPLPASTLISAKDAAQTLNILLHRLSILMPLSPAHYSYSCFIHKAEWFFLFQTTPAMISFKELSPTMLRLEHRIKLYRSFLDYHMKTPHNGFMFSKIYDDEIFVEKYLPKCFRLWLLQVGGDPASAAQHDKSICRV